MRHEPFHLFIASDNTKVVVSTRRPMVDGREKSVTDGPVTDITAVDDEETTGAGYTGLVPSAISPDSPWAASGSPVPFIVGSVGLLVAVVGCLAATWWLGVLLGAAAAGGAGYLASHLFTRPVDDWPQQHVVLTDPSDRDTLRRARTAVGTISRAWPKLASVATAPAPDDVLARALWDLARALNSRQTIRATQHKLQRSLVDLPSDSRMYAEVQARITQAAAGYVAVDADVTDRLGHLTDLAERCRLFLREQAALERARTVVRDADEVLGTMPSLEAGPVVDAGEELSRSTAAVLGAYRELSIQLGVDDVP